MEDKKQKPIYLGHIAPDDWRRDLVGLDWGPLEPVGPIRVSLYASHDVKITVPRSQLCRPIDTGLAAPKDWRKEIGGREHGSKYSNNWKRSFEAMNHADDRMRFFQRTGRIGGRRWNYWVKRYVKYFNQTLKRAACSPREWRNAAQHDANETL